MLLPVTSSALWKARSPETLVKSRSLIGPAPLQFTDWLQSSAGSASTFGNPSAPAGCGCEAAAARVAVTQLAALRSFPCVLGIRGFVAPFDVRRKGLHISLPVFSAPAYRGIATYQLDITRQALGAIVRVRVEN